LIINEKEKIIKYPLALTAVASKIRIKERLTFSDYGLPIAPTKTLINQKHYIEWQIGYDEVVGKEDFHFYGANTKPKKLYELSFIIQKFYKWDIISGQDLMNLKDFLKNNTDIIEDKLEISRTMFKEYEFANLNFLKSFVSYPLLVYKLNHNSFLSEIIIKEKQRAVGIQAMLYFCFPLSLLENEKEEKNFLNRYIKSKEKGYLKIDSTNIDIFLQMLKIFGILSKNHKHDVIEILDFILK